MKKITIVLALVLVSSLLLFANGTAESKEEERVVTVLGGWVSSEQEAFEYVLQGFTEKTGIKVEYEGTSTPTAVLSTYAAAGELPDLAELGGSEGYLTFLNQGLLKDLDFMADDIKANYSDGWITPYSKDGKIYSFPIRCNVQNCLWYNPEVIDASQFESLEDLVAYCDAELAKGNYTWAGLYKGSWTSSLIFNSVLSSLATNEEYSSFMTGHMGFDDPLVIKTLEKVSEIMNKYVKGGASAALGTDLTEGFALVFGTDPSAEFINAGSWGSGIVTGGVNANAVEGKTLSFVLMPGYQSIETNCDNIVMFNDTEEARLLLEYLCSAEGISRFIEYGYVLPNGNIDVALYADYPLAQKAMEYLKDPIVVPTKVMDVEYGNAFYQLVQGCIADSSTIEQQAKTFEANYGSMNTVI